MSDLLKIRKTAVNIETVYHENGPVSDTPLRIGAAYAVVANPYAGEYVEDLLPFMEALKPLGHDLATQLSDALGGPDSVQAYGKGAIVGVEGELEHGAIWHVAGGWSMRSVVGGKAIVPAAKTVAYTGYRLPVPLFHKDACYVRGWFNSMEIGAIDAPKPRELLYGLVMATGSRINDRLGGLRPEEISVNDGQR